MKKNKRKSIAAMTRSSTPILKYANTIIAGTGRAGSTSLFRYLMAHPDVCGSSIKETGFFLRFREEGPRPVLDDYGQYFSHCGEMEKVRVEATPHYLHEALHCAPIIAESLPNVKLIFILRDPAKRLYTVFRNLKSSDPKFYRGIEYAEFVSLGIKEFSNASRGANDIGRRAAHYIRTGVYVEHLSIYMKYFRESSVYIDFFENMKAEPNEFMRRIAAFLEIDPHFYDDFSFTVENKTRTYRSATIDRKVRRFNRQWEPWLNRYPSFKKRVRSIYVLLNEGSVTEERGDDAADLSIAQFYDPWNKRLGTFLNMIEVENGIVRPAWVGQ